MEKKRATKKVKGRLSLKCAISSEIAGKEVKKEKREDDLER